MLLTRDYSVASLTQPTAWRAYWALLYRVGYSFHVAGHFGKACGWLGTQEHILNWNEMGIFQP